MMDKVLTAEQERLLDDERRALRDLQALLVRCEAKREDLDALERSVRQLDQLFLLVVVGEFNSGKSTFINALLGSEILEEGVTPTTTRIHRLRFGDEIASEAGEHGIYEVAAPVDLLRSVEIVDTPGTNALDREHEAITQEFVPRSDLVLFVTSADRPFSESERAFIESIRQWGKKVVVVLNKIDFLTSPEDREKVEAFIREKALALLDFNPELFPISARKALEAQIGNGGTGAGSNGLADLESYLVGVLDDTERIRLKLGNPLGVGLRLLGDYGNAVESRMDLLGSDFTALEEIDGQLDLYREDMAREFRFRLSDVDNELKAFEKRGDEFFEDTFRIARAIDLMNKDRVRADFERKVVADSPKRIEAKVDETIDWMIGAELKQWQAVAGRLSQRLEHHGDRLVGEIGSFDYDREQLLKTVGRAAGEAVDGFDQKTEAARLADSVRNAVAGTALVEVGALGLGTLITILATTQLADFTGVLAAGTLAVLGLFILPARRRRAKAELSAKILELRERLMSALTEQFDQEIERSVHRIQEAVAPYTRFVRAERARLTERRGAIVSSRGELERLSTAVRDL